MSQCKLAIHVGEDSLLSRYGPYNIPYDSLEFANGSFRFDGVAYTSSYDIN